MHLSCICQDEKLTQCWQNVWCFLWNLFSYCSDGEWIPLQLLPAVLTCPVLSCPVLSCPVLSCASCPWLPWPIRDSHTETCHADVLLKDRGRCLLHPSVSVCLCPPLNPALALLTLFSSPLLSLAAPGAAPLLFIHPKHCWGTPAWVLMHRYGRHHGISFYSLPLQPHPLTSCLAWLLPPYTSHPFPCVRAVLPAALLLSLRGFLHTTHNPFCSSSLFLCGCGLVMFFSWFCLVVKMSCCPHSGTRTVSNPRLVSTLTLPPK